jgi:hypothetical protein
MDKEIKMKEALAITIIALIGIWLIPFLTMVCWNNVIPYLFGLKTIGFWQAVCLNGLTCILLGVVALKKNN